MADAADLARPAAPPTGSLIVGGHFTGTPSGRSFIGDSHPARRRQDLYVWRQLDAGADKRHMESSHSWEANNCSCRKAVGAVRSTDSLLAARFLT